MPQVLYVAHAGDSGAVMACTSFSLSFPLRLTADHKPNRRGPCCSQEPALKP
jgi:serine/threonine protein phosphatase PrpC